jgi:hypothetical protein
MFSSPEEETFKGDVASCTLHSILTLIAYHSKNYQIVVDVFWIRWFKTFDKAMVNFLSLEKVVLKPPKLPPLCILSSHSYF